ncbi:MAG TPA: aldehyde dehydrogenase family protein, partial [Burkholderiaceae bacterium]|nr:aldehyde dehydrogenase family protein [Burkholderiaceae bacterium]
MSTSAYTDARDLGHFIAGQRVAARGDRRQPVFNPATGTVARQLQLGTVEDVQAAVAAAQAAFPAWAETPPLRRARVLFKFLELLHRHHDT